MRSATRTSVWKCLGDTLAVHEFAMAARQIGVSDRPSGMKCIVALSRNASFCRYYRPYATPAFAFDIDGVIKRGSDALPQAKQAISAVAGAKQPFVFLTNGGGDTEAQRALDLSMMLDHPVEPRQVIMAHTPMRELLPAFASQTVLICGRGNSLAVARSYGFQRAVSPAQLAAALGPPSVPFSSVPSRHAVSTALDTPCPVEEFGAATPSAPVRAILVFTDPDDWYRDLQLCFDVISDRGILPVRRTPPVSQEEHDRSSSPVAVYFGHDDLLWANSHGAPRFGLGAFRRALATLHEEATGSPLPLKGMYGKPTVKPFEAAREVLDAQARELGFTRADPLYMIGDNPEVDVRGAQGAGSPWVSVLVRTGVFQGHGNYEACPADIVVDDVAAAIEAAGHRQRSQKWHALR